MAYTTQPNMSVTVHQQQTYVHNPAAHLTSATKTFNAHASTCPQCRNPYQQYLRDSARGTAPVGLCLEGRSLSEQLREAFKAQERQLQAQWPDVHHTLDVKLDGVTGAAAEIVAVMNSKRRSRMQTPPSSDWSTPRTPGVLQVAHSRYIPSSSSQATRASSYYTGGYYTSSYPASVATRGTTPSPTLGSIHPNREVVVEKDLRRRKYHPNEKRVRFS